MARAVVCAVGESDSSNEVAVAARLSGTLGLGLVLAHVADGPAGVEGSESLSTVQARQGAGRLLEQAAAEHGLAGVARKRPDVGQPAQRLAQIAAEEDAALIVVGARKAGLFRSSFKSPLAEELAPLARCAVVVATPGDGPGVQAEADRSAV